MRILIINIVIVLLTLSLCAQNELKEKTAADYFIQGDFQKSLKLYREIFQSIDEEDELYSITGLGVIKSLLEIGYGLSKSGDYFYAGIYFKLAYYFNDKYDVLNTNYKAHILLWIGRNYYLMSDYLNAEKFLKKALQYEPGISKERKATINALLADIYYQTGKQNKSVDKFFKKAITLFENSNDSIIFEYIHTLQRYGLILMYEDRIDESEEILLKSYEVCNENFDSPYAIYATNHLGYFYKNIGDYNKALDYFHQSIMNVIPDFKEKNICSFPEKSLLVKHTELLYALRYKAHALYLKYKDTGDIKYLNAAITGFDCVFELIEQERKTYTSQESSLSFANSYSETVNNALLCAIEKYKIDSNRTAIELLFKYMEYGKSSLLYHSVRETDTKRRSGVPLHLIQKEKELESEILIAKMQLDQSDENFETFKGLDKLIELLKEMEDLKKTIESHSIKQLNILDNLNTVSLSEVQLQLKGNEMLLEYSLIDSLLFSICIDQKKCILNIDTIDEYFYNSIFFVRKHIAYPDFNTDYITSVKEFSTESNFLYKRLIAPYEDQIKDKSLIVVPDEKLLFLPFEVLLCSIDTNKLDYRQLDYLLLHNPVSYTYSSALKYGLQQSEKFAEKLMAAYTPDYLADLNCDRKHIKLEALQYAKEETGYITSLIGGDQYNGEMATENIFLRTAADYNIIHLAMHTSINDSFPMLSEFHFTCVDDSVYDNDLDLFELNSLELNARLVVLSGCNTGYGHLYTGEGLYNMARGFIQAGCPSLVLSIWELNDYSGSQIIMSFYDNLKLGNALDISMQRSKTDYLKNASKLQAHPFFWAAYISIGDQTPCDSINRNSRISYIFLGSIPVLFLLFWWINRKKKNK